MSFDCIERPRVNAHPVTGERSVRRERSDVTSDFVGEDGVVAGLRAEGLPDRGPLNDGTLDISHTKPGASFLRTRGASDVDYLRDHSAPLHVTTYLSEPRSRFEQTTCSRERRAVHAQPAAEQPS